MFCLLILLSSLSLVKLDDLKICLEHLASVIGQNGTATLMYYYEVGYEIDIELGNLYRYSIGTNTTRISEHVDWIIFSIAHLKALKTALGWLYQRFINPDTHFVLVYFGYKNDLWKVFRVFWQEFYVNVLVVTLDDLQTFTYYPLSGGIFYPWYVGGCSHVWLTRRESDVWYFNGLMVNVTAMINEPFITWNAETSTAGGFEMEILRLLFKNLRCGAYVSLRPSIKSKWHSIVLGGLQIDQSYDVKDLVYYYMQQEYRLFLLEPKPREPWINLLLIFDLYNWYCLLALLILLTVVIFVTNSVTLGDSFLLIWSTLLQPSEMILINPKALYALWLITAFLLTSFYSSLLLSFMFKPILYPKLDSPEQILSSGMKFCMSKFTASMIDSHFFDFPYEKSHIGESNDCFQLLAKGKHAYLATTCSVASEYEKNAIFYGTRPIYKSLGTILTDLNLPLLKRLQQVMRKLDEFGIIKNIDTCRWNYKKPLYTQEGNVVALNHIYLPMSVHLVGMLLACAAFLIELAKTNIKTKKTTK